MREAPERAPGLTWHLQQLIQYRVLKSQDLHSWPCHFYLYDLGLVTYPFWALINKRKVLTCLSYRKELLERSSEIKWYVMYCKVLHIIQIFFKNYKKKKVLNARAEYFRKHYNQFCEVMNQWFHLFLKATSSL